MGLFNALWMSFYSRPLYRSVLEQWRGIGFFYVCLLALIKTIIWGALIDADMDVRVRDNAPAIVQQIPDITIHKGQARTPEEKAYPIYEPETGKLAALIDTRLDEPSPDMGKIPVFVGKKGLIFDFPFETKPEERPFLPFVSLEQDTIFNRAVMISNLQRMADWGIFFLAPFLFMFQVIYIGVQVLFFSLFTWMTLRSALVQASYAGILRITSISLSPAILCALAVDAFPPVTPTGTFVFILLAFIYITYAAHVLRTPEKEEISQDDRED